MEPPANDRPPPQCPVRSYCTRRRRLALLAALGAVLLLAALGYDRYYLARPVGTGPGGPRVPSELFRKTWTSRPVLLLGIGDSVTAGFGVRQGYGYFDRLRENPADEFPDMQGVSLSAVIPKLRTENLARSGSTSLAHVEAIREFPEQPRETLGLVVITTGGNDLIHNYGRTRPREGAMYGATLAEARPWIANFEHRLGEMLDLVDARFPGGCHVFLADIYDPTDAVGDAASAGLPDWPEGLAVHRAYNEVIRGLTGNRRNVHLVPVHDEFLGHGTHCRQFWREHYRRDDPFYWYAANLEDPNQRGYDALRRLFLLEMARSLAPKH
jgi:lysophospholipase L1-like esterase